MKTHFFNSLLLILVFFNVSFAQDDSEENATSAKTFAKHELQEEEKALNFEKHFIKSIQQRSIKNYNKALENLAHCQQIYPDNTAMLFEIAKNHFVLKQYIEAHHYCNLALQKEPDNFWILELSREIYLKEQNYTAAIEVQKKLFHQKPSEAGNLLRLYYYKKDITNGQKLLEEIDRKNIYSSSFNFYNTFFNKNLSLVDTTRVERITTNSEKSIRELQKEFAKNTDFMILLNLLEKEYTSNQFENLLQDSNMALELFPAQAIIYLYNGLALKELGKHEKAISVLETGVDFVFDKPSLSKRFYTTIILSCNKTKNIAKANKYKQLVQKL